jgi:hypothetical protein
VAVIGRTLLDAATGKALIVARLRSALSLRLDFGQMFVKDSMIEYMHNGTSPRRLSLEIGGSLEVTSHYHAECAECGVVAALGTWKGMIKALIDKEDLSCETLFQLSAPVCPKAHGT